MPWRNDDAARKHSNATYGQAWRRARAECLRRAAWRCQLRLEGCQGAASQADHVIPVSQGGGHEQGNLRAACAACHAKVTAQQGGGWRNGRARGDPDPAPRTRW